MPDSECFSHSVSGMYLRQTRAVAEAERVELLQRIRDLESRSRIVDVASRELNMHLPEAHEIVLLEGGGP